MPEYTDREYPFDVIHLDSALSSVPSKLPANMCSKKPVFAVVDAISDTAECIRLSNGDWVSEPENPELIVKCLREVYETPKEELTAIGQRGLEHVISRFSKSVNLKILVDVCKQIIEKR